MIYVVGLGNPGRRYRLTRHNMGYMVADELAARNRTVSGKRTRAASVREVEIEGARAAIVKPLLFMNRSGEALAGLRGEMLKPENRLLVVYDDSALPFGALRFRRSGSHGGHRGMESLIRVFGAETAPRLRVGIGANAGGEQLEDYVLSPFTKEERERLGDVVATAAEAVETWVRLGIDEAMNRYNRRTPTSTKCE
ncbi:MAG: aminoacyl-tRNA hydrolase [bacterium]